MSYILWDSIDEGWRRTPQYVTVLPENIRIDSQAYANQGSWDDLTTWGIYEEWLSPDSAPLGYLPPVVENIDGRDRAARYPAGTAEERAEATRENKMREIDQQVPDDTARRLIEDPLFADSIQSYSGGASERKSQLEDTPAADVAAFDVTVVPTPVNGAGYVQAKMTTFIDIVDPWAGNTDAIYALVCVCQIITEGESATGESMRAHMFGPGDGPSGAVLPFVQDVVDPTIWRTQSQEGRYWEDPDTSASMRLLWDSGSLPVAETKVLDSYGDRDYAIVRAGLPEARGRR